MGMRDSFFKKIEKKKIWQVITFVICEVLVIGLYFFVGDKIEFNKRVEKVQKLTEVDDSEIMFDIDGSVLKHGKINISGWALRLNSINTDISIVLESADDSGEYILPAKLKEREDKEEYYDADWDFGSCGFEVAVKEKQLDKNSCYEIFVCLSYEGKKENEKGVMETVDRIKKIATGHYLCDGQLYQYNPIEFVAPSVADEEMQKVIQEGQVCAYDIDKGAWVYEYESRLYWVIDYSIIGDLKEKPEVSLQVYTTSVERLPEDKVSLGRDYIGHLITEEDLERKMDGNYFVYSAPLPTGYPITRIVSGIYKSGKNEKGWSWRAEFQYVAQ